MRYWFLIIQSKTVQEKFILLLSFVSILIRIIRLKNSSDCKTNKKNNWKSVQEQLRKIWIPNTRKTYKKLIPMLRTSEKHLRQCGYLKNYNIEKKPKYSYCRRTEKQSKEIFIMNFWNVFRIYFACLSGANLKLFGKLKCFKINVAIGPNKSIFSAFIFISLLFQMSI